MATNYWKSCKDCKGFKNLRYLITVKKNRATTTRSVGSNSPVESVEKGQLWADIRTKAGLEVFEGTNSTAKMTETHQFIVRYGQISSSINKDDLIIYNNIIYAIDKIENVDQENKWIVVSAHSRGDSSINRNTV